MQNELQEAAITRRGFLKILLGLGGIAAAQAACALSPETFLSLVTPPSPTAFFVPTITRAPTSAPPPMPTLAPTPSPPPTVTPAPTVAPIDFDAWLNARPNFLRALVWQTQDKTKSYADWTAAEKAQLATTFDALRRGNWKGLAAEPPLAVTPAPNETAMTRVTPDVAWQYYLAYAAQSLVVESERWVPWSVVNYTVDELALLLDSRLLFAWEAATRTYAIPADLGYATPGDPLRLFGFLQNNKLIGATPRQTIAALLNWCRDNLIHFLNGYDSANVYQHWQYSGWPPVEKVIAGTISGAEPSAGVKHWTGGCWGTTGFLRVVLRTANIPVQLVEMRGHALPRFFHEALYLSHGDDPYNAYSIATPPIPADELFIDLTKFRAWFGYGVSQDKLLQNVGRRPRELAVQYLPNMLMWYYCRDQAAGKSHAAGEVYGSLKNDYSVAELEAARLWERMDAKIASAGGCSRIPER